MLSISVVTKTQRLSFNVAIIIYGYLKSRMHNCSVKGIHNIWQIIGIPFMCICYDKLFGIQTSETWKPD